MKERLRNGTMASLHHTVVLLVLAAWPAACSGSAPGPIEAGPAQRPPAPPRDSSAELE